MAELADAPDSGSGLFEGTGSSPAIRTKKIESEPCTNGERFGFLLNVI